MDHDVVDDRGRRHHALPVKMQVAIAQAGRPAIAKLLHCDTSRLYSDLGCESYHSPAQALAPLIFVEVLEGLVRAVFATLVDNRTK